MNATNASAFLEDVTVTLTQATEMNYVQIIMNVMSANAYLLDVNVTPRPPTQTPTALVTQNASNASVSPQIVTAT